MAYASASPSTPAAAVAAAVLQVLPTMPAKGMPSLLDALMQATSGCRPSLLLQQLLDNAPFKQPIEPVQVEADEELAKRYMAAQMHLLKHPESAPSDLARVLFTWWIPLLQKTSVNLSLLQAEVVRMLAEAVSMRNAWSYIQESVVPLCLLSLNHGISGTSGLETTTVARVPNATAHNDLHDLNNKLFAVPVACQLLATLADTASKLLRGEDCTDGQKEDCLMARHFCKALFSGFFPVAIAMLSQTSSGSLRQCASLSLLPALLKAPRDCCRPARSSEAEDSGQCAVEEVWFACKSLLSQGIFERRDAYITIAQLVDFLLGREDEDQSALSFKCARKFDARNDPHFWEFVKSGLVDSDSSIRKRALFLLKRALSAVLTSQTTLLQSSQQNQASTGKKNHLPAGVQPLNKRDKWAQKEAMSLGIGASTDLKKCKWDAFLLLYDTLEEYGTHLVEATWDLQMSLLMLPSETSELEVALRHNQRLQPSDVGFDISWVSVLWQQGFAHKNPQVRQLVLQSFFKNSSDCTGEFLYVTEEFVFGPLLQALNDSVHHKDFGTNELYSSDTIRSAANWFWAYTRTFQLRKRQSFVLHLANAAVLQSPCRAGLMGMASWIEVVAVGHLLDENYQLELAPVSSRDYEGGIIQLGDELQLQELMEGLKLMVDTSRRHFNPRYRAQVCGHLLRAASSLVSPFDIPVSRIAYFLSSFPRDLFVQGGLLHGMLVSWLQPQNVGIDVRCNPLTWMFEGLCAMAEEFLCSNKPASLVLSDDDVDSWRSEGERWARMLSVGVLSKPQQLMLVKYVEKQASEVYHRAYMATHRPEKILVLLWSLVRECQQASSDKVDRACDAIVHTSLQECHDPNGSFAEEVANTLLSTFDELLAYARWSTFIFWEHGGSTLARLPGSVTGKLGGPSQRRLPASLTSSVLQAVVAVTTVADGCVWYSSVNRAIPESVQRFLWSFAWEVATFRRIDTEVDAELILGAYEALSPVCCALAAAASPRGLSCGYAAIQAQKALCISELSQPGMLVDELVKALLDGVENLLRTGLLARSRRAVLARFKWCCLDALLSVSRSTVFNCVRGAPPDSYSGAAISSSTLHIILKDCIESLESAGEEYLLPLFRVMRWLMVWGVFNDAKAFKAVHGQSRLEVMWAVVNAAWAAIADCNKRKVAPISAFISTILHPAIFHDVEMHKGGENQEMGPLKWLLSRLFKEGERSPRIMRLTTLHVTGMWLRFPATLIYYISDILLLTLHGGETVDEELDGEIRASQAAAREYRTLIQSSDPELLEAFTNSEMYVRVSVAVMFHELALIAEEARDDTTSTTSSLVAGLGRTFTVSLLHTVVEDPILSKELYKKKTVIHRKKVRAWQMLCILSRFIDDDVVLHVMSLLETCLHRNNFPTVRQYIEGFALQMFLRFPHLVKEHLVSFLRDYNLKTQALSSYVLVAANVLIFTQSQALQMSLLQEVFPAILPYMTSHHHNLRSFTQVLIHRLITHFKAINLGPGGPDILGNESLASIAAFLDANSDCVRIRTSVEKYLDYCDPASARTPRGIFSSRGGEPDSGKTPEDLPFECVSIAVVDKVAEFLNEARESLRDAVAADAIALNAEALQQQKGSVATEERISWSGSENEAPAISNSETSASPLDFQKKIESLRFSGGFGSQREAEHEEEILLSTMESRVQEISRMRGGRQELIVVASLLGRIPNLAGLARTCEVFKAASLVVADARVTLDRQFQLISVTAEKWVPIVEVPEGALMDFLKQKKREGFALLGLEQTANSISIETYSFPRKSVLVLGREREGIPVEIIQALDSCLEIPQLGVIRSLNVHVSGAIAVWEYTRKHLKPVEC